MGHHRIGAYNQGLAATRTLLEINESYEGEPIEKRVERMMNNKQPLTDASAGPLIYTQRADGVIPEFNIRTDRFDLALDDPLQKAEINKRQSLTEPPKEPDKPSEPTNTATTPQG